MPLKILVVEDDLATLELMREVLASFGVVVRALHDSQEAAAVVQGEKFDGIFLDLLMPAVDGFELARQIRRSRMNSRVPIVIVTGREGKKTMQEAFAAGATFFLQKPVDKQKLIYLLNSTRGAMVEERRRFKRIPLHAEVTWQVDARKATGTSSNLGLNGILFQVDNSVEVGSAIRLSFRLPQQQLAIEVEGEVVRVDEKKRAGVRFTLLSPEDRQRLREFVASQDVP